MIDHLYICGIKFNLIPTDSSQNMIEKVNLYSAKSSIWTFYLARFKLAVQSAVTWTKTCRQPRRLVFHYVTVKQLYCTIISLQWPNLWKLQPLFVSLSVSSHHFISNWKVPYVRNRQFRKNKIYTKAFMCPVLVLCNLNLIGKFFHPLPMGFIISFFQKISERKYILWKVFFSQHFWRPLDILLRRWYRRKCSWKGFLFNKDFSFCIFVPY